MVELLCTQNIYTYSQTTACMPMHTHTLGSNSTVPWGPGSTRQDSRFHEVSLLPHSHLAACRKCQEDKKVLVKRTEWTKSSHFLRS